MQILQYLLLGFLLFSMISILWSTIRYGISPMPSNQKARESMLGLVPSPIPKTIFELGSGWGNLAYELASQHPDSMIYGYERSLLPFLFSRLYFRRDNLQFEFKNFQKTSFSPDSLLVCYLYPKGMQQLSDNPNIKNCWLISNTFALPDRQALKKVQIDDLYRSTIFLYQI